MDPIEAMQYATNSHIDLNFFGGENPKSKIQNFACGLMSKKTHISWGIMLILEYNTNIVQIFNS